MGDEQNLEGFPIGAAPPERLAVPAPGHSTGTTPTTLPSGTVTFLFTDIEGSTSLWEHDPQAMQRAFARQEAIVREAMAAHGGYVYKMVGDAFQVAFSTASAALAAALAAQRVLHAEPWGPVGVLRVRMALHTGVTEERGDDYVGPELNRIARLLSAGHGGQVLLSGATADLVRDHLPEGVTLRDLGQHTLRGLVRAEHVYQAVAQGLPADYPALKAADARPHNLPSPTTPFVGREAELAQMEALLRDPGCRLISLVGLGGSGKTRLAIQAAAQSADPSDPGAFPEGVYFVGLGTVSTPEGVISTIADALGMSFDVRPGSSLALEAAQAQVLRYLAGKGSLLVLDNCEHLLAEQGSSFADLVSELLAGAPGVKLIATSRERLNLPGEWAVEVAGLSYPGRDEARAIPEYAAVQLFVKGAERAGPFAAGGPDWPAIARVCQLLGGMPLGVEMAAAWTKVLSCQEIAADLERDLLSLIATWRTVPERHRTLRTVLDHSWRLLSEEERDVCCRLSVFRSSFRREAAAQVAGASLSILAGLIDKSFLHRAMEGRPERRFEIHPALRQYAVERLAADPAAYAEARTRHARYYSTWLGTMFEKLKGSEQLAALAALRNESQNLHDAWRWLIVERDEDRLRGVLPGMILFHEMRGRPVEAQEMVGLLLDMLDTLGYALGSGAGAEPTAADEGDEGLLALALAALRHFGLDPGAPERTNRCQRESLQIAARLPDGQAKAFALLLNGMGPGMLNVQESRALSEQCIGIFTRLGDGWGTALAQLILGDVAGFGDGEHELARSQYQASLEGFTKLGNEWGRAMCLTGLSHLEHWAGHLEGAYRMRQEALDTYIRMGDAWRVMMTRHDLGEIAEDMGAFDEAQRYYGANMAYAARMGDDRERDQYREHLQRLDERAGAASSGLASDLAERTPSAAAVQAGLAPFRLGARRQPPVEELEAPVEPLSEREIEVLALLAEGLSNREIAQQLYLSPNTVRVHTHHIYGKLGVSNRTQAAAKGRALGLLPSS
jgi:predicted ATPase/class 3 adenylate cyclase/DNA-binding CsgD family transcriptional regulator